MGVILATGYGMLWLRFLGTGFSQWLVLLAAIILGCLCLRLNLSVPLTIKILMGFLVGSAVCIASLVGTTILHRHDVENAREYRDISYLQYGLFVDDREFVPKGASRIWSKTRRYEGLYVRRDRFVKMRISRQAYHCGVVVVSEKSVRCDARGFIGPRSSSMSLARPHWWSPPAKPGVELTCWGSDLNSEAPWRTQWAFDNETSTLWIWEWSR